MDNLSLQHANNLYTIRDDSNTRGALDLSLVLATQNEASIRSDVLSSITRGKLPSSEAVSADGGGGGGHSVACVGVPVRVHDDGHK